MFYVPQPAPTKEEWFKYSTSYIGGFKLSHCWQKINKRNSKSFVMTTKMSEKSRRVCENGHVYYKSSDCPVCPVCEKEKNIEGFLAVLGAPARRALENVGIKTEKQLSGKTETEILKLHGMGPSSIPTLRAALKSKGLSFKK